MSEKWVPQAWKRIVVGYNRPTIYRFYIKKQQKVIRVKNLQIFKDYKVKKSIELLNYSDDILIFQKFLLNNNNEKELKFHISLKVNSKRKKEQKMPIPYKNPKVNAREEEYLTFKA